ncbi:MAG: serine/threonine-protein kinase HipA [Planctomycetota bacterium]
MSVAGVHLWGTRIGAVRWEADRSLGFFEYDPAFLGSGVQVAPLMMPLSKSVQAFPALDPDTYHGLPGILADSLPDRFGNALINAWLASRGRSAESFNPVERLCYTGTRGMGALEFQPAQEGPRVGALSLNVAALVNLASSALTDREGFVAKLGESDAGAAVRDILRVGTSAGGARAKAVIAWNPISGEVRSGQVCADRLDAEAGFSHWLLKFDGVSGNADRELAMPLGYGRIEFAYSEMAKAAGIEMSDCRLLLENDRAHFVTRRFDRTDKGHKLHLQSLCALAHLDFNQAGAHSYEQAFRVLAELGLGAAVREELFRRMAFNIVARNQDDHTKNIAFLMDRRGNWSLAPAFDLTYAFNPAGQWTNRHQMTMNGKREDFSRADFKACGKSVSLRRGRALELVDLVIETVARWNEFADKAGVEQGQADEIGRNHRLELPA